MAQRVGQVILLEGEAIAIDENGQERRLHQGDAVFENERIVTMAGSRLEIGFDQTGARFLLRANESVVLDMTVFGSLPPESTEAALLPRVDETIDPNGVNTVGSSFNSLMDEITGSAELLQRVSTGVDPASIGTDGFQDSGSGFRPDDGNRFVQLFRTVESVADKVLDVGGVDRVSESVNPSNGGTNPSTGGTIPSGSQPPIVFPPPAPAPGPGGGPLPPVVNAPIPAPAPATAVEGWVTLGSPTAGQQVAEGGSVVYMATVSVPVTGRPLVVELSNGQTITIPVGGTSASVTVPVRADDPYRQGTETIEVTIRSADGGGYSGIVTGGTVTNTVVDSATATAVTVGASLSTVNEGGSVVYTASVTSPVTGSPLVVTLDNGATITIPVGQSSGTSDPVSVRADDAYVQGTQTVKVGITGVTGGNFESLTTDSVATTTVTDNGTVATVTLSSATAGQDIVEGGSITYTATVGAPVAGTALVVALSNGGTITIPVGGSSASTTVPVRADNVYADGDQGLAVTITGTSGGNFEGIAATGTVNNTVVDDADATTIALTGPASVTEGLTATYTLTLSQPAASPVVVTLVYGGTASAGADFTPVATVTIPAGASSATFDLAVTADGVLEATEFLSVAIGTISGGGFESLVADAAQNAVSTTLVESGNAPVNTVPPSPQTAAEDSVFVFGTATSNAISVDDVDSVLLTTTLTVTNGTLTAVMAAGATITGNGTDTVTISGSAAQINAALDGLSYASVPDYSGSAQLTIRTSDGQNTGTNTVSLAITPVADAVDDPVIVNEDTSIAIAVLGNDTFENSGRQITAVDGVAIVAGGPAVAVEHGSVILDGSEQLVFTPDADYAGPATFTYTVTSGGTTETATVSVTVVGVNDAPVAADDTKTTDEDTVLTESVPVATDVDGTVASYQLLSGVGAGNGTLTFNADGSYSFDPSGAFDDLGPTQSRDVTFTYTATDNDGGVSVPKTVTITVTGVNDVPVASPDANTTNEDTVLTANVPPAADVDGTVAGYQLVSGVGAGNGTLTFNADGSYSFDPSGAFDDLGPAQSRDVTFTYTATDNDGGVSAAKTVTITVSGVNDPATITVGAGDSDLGSVTEDTATPTLSASGTLSVADEDAGQSEFDPASVSFVAGASTVASALGSLSIDAAGAWTYSVANAAVQYLGAGQSETVVFEVASNDGTATHRVTITVNGVNDGATITVGAGNDDTGSVNEDTATPTLTATGTLSVIDVDAGQAEFDPSSVSFVAGASTVASALGSLAIDATGAWTYTVANAAVQYLGAGQSETVVFEAASRDGTAKHQVTITVNGVNDGATITVGASDRDTGSVTEDTAMPTLTATGTLSVADADAGQSEFNPASVTFLPGSSTVASALGSLAIDAAGAWTYTVANAAVQYLGAGQSETLVFEVASKDGTATHRVTITVNGVNDGATITVGAGDDDTGSVTEDSATPTLAATGALSVADADAGQSEFDPASVTFVAGASTVGSALGSLAIDATGAWTYTVANAAVQYLGAGQSETLVFEVASKDGTAKHQVTITVSGVNDGATITVGASDKDIGSVTEDTATPTLTATGTLSVADADAGQAEFDPASVTFVAGASTVASALGSLAIDATGTWTYSVANAAVQYLGAGQSETLVFEVASRDGTAKHQVTITVNGVNDGATITVGAGDEDTGSVTEDTATPTLSATGTLSVADADAGQAEFDPASVTFVAAASSVASALGSLAIDAAGAWTYTVANAAVQYLGAGQSETVVFDVASKDGTATHRVTITVNGVNDGATITVGAGDQDTGAVTEDTSTPTLTASGTLSVADADARQAEFDPSSVAFVAGASTVPSALGSLAIDATGAWTYTVANAAVQHLGAGQSETVVFEVASKDGTAKHQVTITVNGVNDGATITVGASDRDTGSVTEDTATPTLTATGTLSVADADAGQSEFNPASVTFLPGSSTVASALGSLAIDAAGAWTYTVANAAVQYLGAGQSETVVFEVASKDGTAKHQVTITVNGVNDAATITVGAGDDDTGSVTEDAATPTLSASGTLSVADADAGQAEFDPASVSFVAAASTVGSVLGSLAIDATGAWTYTVANAAVQYLGAGQSETLVFEVASKDGTATHQVTITVNGVNDGATITVGASDKDIGSVTEDTATPTLTATGTLSVADADAGQAEFDPASVTFVAGASTVASALGSLAMDATGTWIYSVANAAVQYLGAGQERDVGVRGGVQGRHGQAPGDDHGERRERWRDESLSALATRTPALSPKTRPRRT